MFSQVATSLEQRETASVETQKELNTRLDTLTRMVETLGQEVRQLRLAGGARPMHPSHRGGSGAGGMQSTGMNPQPQPLDPRQAMRNDILAALQVGSYEAAFTKALSASTAEMAVFCCKNANLTHVLGGSKPALSQPILLCLMQQLGAVLVSSKDSDLQTTLAWLQEIALTLDPSNESIQRHVPGVLQQLVASINAKMGQGDPSLRRPLQMLLQVIRGMQR